MASERLEQQRALQTSQRAVTSLDGKGKPKIGPEEFMALAARFGFSKRALDRIRRIVEKENWGDGPFLANYYAGLKETGMQAFERSARTVFGSKYAIAASSGTGALHSAFVAAGVGPGTEVICPAIGFMATPAAVVQSKGVPIFCDVDLSLHMDPAKIESLITNRTTAIAATHVNGGVCDMPAIMRIARRHSLKVIEDCAQACGGRFDGRFVGTFGHIGAFSISAYKIVGAGEGGLILTDDRRLQERARGFLECGGLWRPDRFAPPRYAGELFCGTNYRISDLEATIDAVQIRKAPAVARRFNAVKRRVLKRLRSFRGIVPQRSNDINGEVGYFLRFFPETIALAEQIVNALRAKGILSSTRGKKPKPDWHIYHETFAIMQKGAPVRPDCSYECPHYIARGGHVEYARGMCPVADDLFDRVVNVPLNQWYSAEDCRRLSAAINEVFAAYCTPDSNGAPWI